MNKECIKCLEDSFNRLVENQLLLTEEKKGVLDIAIKNYFNNLNHEFIAPVVSRDIYRIVKKITKVNDPFKKIKYESNRQLLNIYDSLIEIVNNSNNKFTQALRIAIAGNIIDYAVCKHFNIFETINYVLKTDYAINHAKQLQEKISKAKIILYLGDNAGEIVLDKLFLQTINHPNVYYVVRGKSIQNDITIVDAEQCSIDAFAKVIENGNDAPSTILSECSNEFMEIYKKADLIISKGQGNFEGLQKSTDSRIFFLLMVKCQNVAEILNVTKGDFIVKQNVL